MPCYSSRVARFSNSTVQTIGFWRWGKFRILYIGVSNHVDNFFYKANSTAEFENHTTLTPQHHTAGNVAVFVDSPTHIAPSKEPKLPHFDDLLVDIWILPKLHFHLGHQPCHEAGQAEHVLKPSCVFLSKLLARDLAKLKKIKIPRRYPKYPLDTLSLIQSTDTQNISKYWFQSQSLLLWAEVLWSLSVVVRLHSVGPMQDSVTCGFLLHRREQEPQDSEQLEITNST